MTDDIIPMPTSPPPIATLFAKLARVMGKIETIPKDGRNEFYKYDYATASSVSHSIRKLLSEEKVAFFAETMHIQDAEGKYIVEYRYTFACGDTGATHSCKWFGESQNTNSKGGIDDKALAKAATIAQKYFLLKTFIASTGDDPDADAEENRPPSRKQKPAATNNKPPQGSADPNGKPEPGDQPEDKTDPVEHPWPSKESLQELFDVTRRKLIPNATDREIAAFAGVNFPFDAQTWRKLYPTRTAAAEQIKHAWEKPPTPSKSGNGSNPSQSPLDGAVGAHSGAPSDKPELSSGASTIVAAELGRGGEVLLFEGGSDDKPALTLVNRSSLAVIDGWGDYALSWKPGQRYTFLLDGKPDLVADWQEIETALGNVARSMQTIAPAPTVDVSF